MRIVCIIVYYALALMGCSPARTVTDLRSDIDGRVVHGRVETREGINHFECLRSASGTCHFVVHAADCTPTAARSASCVPPTIDRVDVASGRIQDVLGLPKGIRVCLALDAGGHC
jgi:hypothetical protein